MCATAFPRTRDDFPGIRQTAQQCRSDVRTSRRDKVAQRAVMFERQHEQMDRRLRRHVNDRNHAIVPMHEG